MEIEIPPLQDRKDDIKTFITTNQKYLKGKEIGKGFWEIVLNHDWPGNMRELITVLKRAGILLESPLTREKIKEIIYGSGYRKAFKTTGEETWKEEIWDAFKNGKNFGEVVKERFLNRDLNRQQVKTILAEALSQTDGNYKDTLSLFNIEESEYGIFMKFLYRNNLN